MIKCPKCWSWRIVGPVYKQDQFGERLCYKCAQCGYSETSPTHDNNVTEPHRADWQKDIHG